MDQAPENVGHPVPEEHRPGWTLHVNGILKDHPANRFNSITGQPRQHPLASGLSCLQSVLPIARGHLKPGVSWLQRAYFQEAPLTRSCVKLQTLTHACLHMHILYMCKYIHTCLHIYSHTYIHTFIHSYMHTYMHACIHTYMHACMHAGIHKHITYMLCLPTYIICLHTYILR